MSETNTNHPTVAERKPQRQTLGADAERALHELRSLVAAQQRRHAARILNAEVRLPELEESGRGLLGHMTVGEARTALETRRDESTASVLELGHVLDAVKLLELVLIGGAS